LMGGGGAATARVALQMLGGTYGRRVVVVAGKVNNGNDGRAAAERLGRRGVQVHVIPAAEAAGGSLPPADLIVDAAYGTGFRGEYQPPDAGGAPVLAVDIPSGVDGLTGQVSGGALAAERTVTFAALKPGLLFHPGRALSGEVTVADIGLDAPGARIGVVEDRDVAAWVPPRPAVAHKWQAAVLLVAGSPGMTGAAHLAARAAQRAGAGMVRVASPGVAVDPGLPTEAVGVRGCDRPDWDRAAAAQLDRAGAVVVGPGLGRGETTTALGPAARGILGARSRPAVLTPHDGEFARLAGSPPGPDRIAAATDLAQRLGAIVLLKGPTTVVAEPEGRARLVTTGDQRLATAGTGDVLSGIIGALLARGVDPFAAAAAGAWLHGVAAQAGPVDGLVASDVVDAIPEAMAAVRVGDGVG
jgi:NAD(P)H-hydrate repair Nnr-like enzyme with NAD(P)H-hydrate dehydratase domain/NAD(P)H-hydrate repair Nnr-like enzyme with NAD(P)H-hydrate epimerase domain